MSTILLNAFGKRIKDAVSNPARLKAAVAGMHRYFDKNHDAIFDSNPGKRLIFGNQDQEVIFQFTDIQPEEVELELAKVSIIEKSWKLLNTPFVILSVLCIRELMLQKKDTEKELVIMYLAMKFYSSRQRRSFPFEPNPNIMAYTINNLSDKFKYKKLQNNYNVVKDTVLTSHDTYKQQLGKGEDEVYLIYVPQMENRIGKIMNAIAEEFYRNRDEKNYLNTEKSFDDEGDVVDKGNLSDTIHSLADGVTHDFVSQKVNMGLVRIVSERNQLPFTTVYQTLNEIRTKESPDTVIGMMKLLFNVVGEGDPTIFERVCSKDFAVTALRQISVSNTTNEDLLKLKKILDDMLMKHCTKYVQTNRTATKMQYRNVLFSYLVYMIVLHKCR
jgi:hypothetical protein